MSEHVPEKDLLIECLPLGGDSQVWAEIEERILDRKPDCPPVIQLLHLRRGLLPPEEAERLRKHAASCSYCGLWAPGAEGGPESDFAAALKHLAALPPEEGDEPAPVGTVLSEDSRPADWFLPTDVPAELWGVINRYCGVQHFFSKWLDTPEEVAEEDRALARSLCASGKSLRPFAEAADDPAQREQFRRLLDLARCLEPGKDEEDLVQSSHAPRTKGLLQSRTDDGEPPHTEQVHPETDGSVSVPPIGRPVRWRLEGVWGLIEACLAGAGADPGAFSPEAHGQRLQDHLVGPDARAEFKGMYQELRRLWGRVDSRTLRPVDKLVLWHHPEMGLLEGGGTRWGLSRRRFLAHRFEAWLRENGVAAPCVGLEVHDKLVDLVERTQIQGDGGTGASDPISLIELARRHTTTFVVEEMHPPPVILECFRRRSCECRSRSAAP